MFRTALLAAVALLGLSSNANAIEMFTFYGSGEHYAGYPYGGQHYVRAVGFGEHYAGTPYVGYDLNYSAYAGSYGHRRGCVNCGNVWAGYPERVHRHGRFHHRGRYGYHGSGCGCDTCNTTTSGCDSCGTTAEVEAQPTDVPQDAVPTEAVPTEADPMEDAPQPEEPNASEEDPQVKFEKTTPRSWALLPGLRHG